MAIRELMLQKDKLGRGKKRGKQGWLNFGERFDFSESGWRIETLPEGASADTAEAVMWVVARGVPLREVSEATGLTVRRLRQLPGMVDLVKTQEAGRDLLISDLKSVRGWGARRISTYYRESVGYPLAISTISEVLKRGVADGTWFVESADPLREPVRLRLFGGEPSEERIAALTEALNPRFGRA